MSFGTLFSSCVFGTMNCSRNPRYAAGTLYLEATVLVARSRLPWRCTASFFMQSSSTASWQAQKKVLSLSFSLFLSSSLCNLPLSPPSFSPGEPPRFFPSSQESSPFLRASTSIALALLARSPSLPPPACYLGIAILCSPFLRVSRKAKWSFCSAFTAGARGREAYNFLGVFIAG